MTYTLTTDELRDIVANAKTSLEQYLALELLANREAQPVLYASEETLAYAKEGEKSLVTWSEPMGDAVIPLFTAPPAAVNPELTRAPAVTSELLEAMAEVIRISDRDHDAWNRAKEAITSCRAAMLSGGKS
ncbi:hypothetical protein F0336_14300 [Serratia liquefaciens]|uniref:hypothetical protein n=1 Tax=Serratia liquefaciens TaxID=614 RepID=UPI0011F24497|nr:hypothetical protein [Serratia liquefaciens]QIC84884.1 hypothetical protein F0336_14300 [Serratia liquefaciens]